MKSASISIVLTLLVAISSDGNFFHRLSFFFLPFKTFLHYKKNFPFDVHISYLILIVQLLDRSDFIRLARKEI